MKTRRERDDRVSDSLAYAPGQLDRRFVRLLRPGAEKRLAAEAPRDSNWALDPALCVPRIGT